MLCADKVPEKATEPLVGSPTIGQQARVEKGVVHSGARSLPLVGDTASFSCNPDFELVGADTVTCGDKRV